jgi:uncharacterized protein YdeI (YjbR/CyaY-like superfamily)
VSLGYSTSQRPTRKLDGDAGVRHRTTGRTPRRGTLLASNSEDGVNPIELTSSDHPETWKFGYSIYHARSRDQWRSWFEANHDATRGVWLCSWRTVTGGPRCPYPDAVEEAICFGWIDSTTTTLDDERGLQLFTPRKAKSSWTRLNRRRAFEMEAQGKMTDAGRRTIDAAKKNGWWLIFDPVEDLIEPDDLRRALDTNPSARVHWDQFPPSARKIMLWWVVSAAKEETRVRRIDDIVVNASAGERARR